MIFLQRKIFYYYKEQLSVYFQYVALFGFEQEGILIGFMRIAEGNLEMLFITTNKPRENCLKLLFFAEVEKKKKL